MTNYSKSAYSLLAHPETLVVNRVVWVLRGTRDELSSEFGMTTDLPPPQEDFVPYEELSETLVLSWIDEHTPADRLAEAQAWLNRRLDEMAVVPPEIQPLPWVQAQESIDISFDAETSLAVQNAL